VNEAKNGRGIINTYDQMIASGCGVAIVVSWGGIRDRYVDGWLVLRRDKQGREVPTDPKAPWYHHGHKWFGMRSNGSFAERRHEAFLRAAAWVAEQGWYSGEWKRNALGDFVPADVQKRFPIKRRANPKPGEEQA
jgi:hypothetical protein